jgi:hypothetical protein
MTTTGSSFFNKAASDPSSLGEKFTGPNYVYSKWIKSPTEMGMNGGGSLDDLADNVSGLMNYMTVLTEGGGPALKTGGQNLGDRYFLSTGGKCQDSQGNSVTRSLYIDNVPDGGAPALKKMGMGDSAFNGLIPGLLNDVMALNPVQLFGAFMSGSTPNCTNIHMKTIDSSNKDGTGSGFVVNSEIKNMNPCAFVNGKNPITGDSCETKESFVNANIKMGKSRDLIVSTFSKRRPLADLYTATVGGLFVFLLYKMLYRSN